MADAGDKKSSGRFVITAIAIIVVLLLGAIIASTAFKSQQEKSLAGKPIGDAEVTDGLIVDATVTAVDPLKGEMSVRLAMTPEGVFNDAGLLQRPVTLYYSSADGTKQIDMKVGKPLAPVDVSLPLLGDTVSSYPWDSYNADMDLLFLTTDNSNANSGTTAASSTTPSSGGSGGSGESTTTTAVTPGSAPGTGVTPTSTPPPTTEEGLGLPLGESAMSRQDPPAGGGGGTSGGDKPSIRPDTVVPTQVRIFTNIPAYTVVEVTDSTPNNDGVLEVGFTVNRAKQAIAYSVFVSILMWVLAIGVMLVALSVLFHRRKLELAVVSMMGVILFAMPAALRSFQPGIPPPGVLSDFYSFFWCLAIVAISLVVMLAAFVTRGPD